MKDTMKGMYIACASALGYGDVTKIKTGTELRKKLITECADGYIKATEDGDETKRSQYISALMLMFWGEIGKMADKCKAVSELEYDDFASKLYECINTACEYHAWKDGKHTAEACIRATIGSRGAAAILYESNLDKNKANVNNYSLDAAINDDEGHEVTKLDLLEDEDENIANKVEDPAIRVIQNFLDRNKPVEAIMLDTAAFGDCVKQNKETLKAIDPETEKEYKYVKVTNEFWTYKLIQTLSSLPADYFDYFKSRYDVNDAVLQAAIDKIKATPNTKLYKAWELVKADAKITAGIN